MSSTIKTVGVIGTGVIGSSWIALFLAHGLQVLVSDPAPNAEEQLAAYIESAWPTLKAMGLASNAAPTNYKFVGSSLDGHYGEVDFVQENAPEKLGLKTKPIGEIDAGTAEHVVIASSSSGLPSSEFIGECKKNPGRVLIGHPFNPPHLMPLVEVVPHGNASRSAIDSALDFYKSVGKKPVLLNHESPGFVANRLQTAVCHEAYSLVARGVISALDLDTCMTTSLGPRWALTGPFLSNAMGGGGGRDGFKHMMEHIVPASHAWLEDMRAHEFTYSKEDVDKLNTSVQRELDARDITVVGKERDRVLLQLLQNKKSATSLD